MVNYIVTSGINYTDIDVLACVLSYTQLLTLKGFNTISLFSGPQNNTITNYVKSFGYEYDTTIPSDFTDYKAVVVDTSQPDTINALVDQSKIVQIFDHHFGFEKYWQERLGDKSVIEPIGACATLIWQEFIKEGFQDNISQKNARLLYIAILSHTLNLKASVTTKADIEAISQLEKQAQLPGNWKEQYFTDTAKEIFLHPKEALLSDAKQPEINGKVYAITQIELWKSKKFIKENFDLISEVLENFNSELAFLTCPSISEGKTYFVAINAKTKELLKNLIGAQFVGKIGSVKRLYLRKEIIREIQTS